MVLLQGMNCTILVQLWSVIVSIESCPHDEGNLVMKSNVMTSNSFVSSVGYIGWRGAFVGWLFTLYCWHSSHPRM